MSVAILSSKGKHAWLRFTLTEGKKNEIREAVRHFGCHVTTLIREEYGPFQLGKIRPGDVQQVNLHKELCIMRRTGTHVELVSICLWLLCTPGPYPQETS